MSCFAAAKHDTAACGIAVPAFAGERDGNAIGIGRRRVADAVPVEDKGGSLPGRAGIGGMPLPDSRLRIGGAAKLQRNGGITAELEVRLNFVRIQVVFRDIDSDGATACAGDAPAERSAVIHIGADALTRHTHRQLAVDAWFAAGIVAQLRETAAIGAAAGYLCPIV